MNSTVPFEKYNISELSKEQKYAFHKFMNGHNLFITGPGGTGKSKLIQFLHYFSKRMNKNCQVCSLTGCSAILLNCEARTVHSWSGIKLARGPKEQIIDAILKSKKLTNTWRKIHILIVDEVSMMSLKIFELLEEIGRVIRRNSSPFGGIQIVFTGDFFQLPPVPSPGEPDTEKFCFESPIWSKLFSPENHIELLTIFRQNDPVYIDILMEIRRGSISEKNVELLQKYVKREYDPEQHNGCVPTKLFAIRNKADFINKLMFDKIEQKTYEFKTTIKTDCKMYLDSGRPFPFEVMVKCQELSAVEIEREIEYLSKSVPSDSTLQLKIGSNVMCCFNIDVDNGICNGSQGVIVNMLENESTGNHIPIVKFSNGVIMPMERHYWQSSEYPCIAISQIPLCLSWALTIHKTQGSTMTMAEMDIGLTIFEYGQVYVALSRIKSLDGLYLINFNPNKIKANPKVIEFYDKIPKHTVDESDFISSFSQYNYVDDKTKELQEDSYIVPDESVKTIRFVPSKKLTVIKSQKT